MNAHNFGFTVGDLSMADLVALKCDLHDESQDLANDLHRGWRQVGPKTMPYSESEKTVLRKRQGIVEKLRPLVEEEYLNRTEQLLISTLADAMARHERVCRDCGELGHDKGAMECQSPQNTEDEL